MFANTDDKAPYH